MSTEYVISYYKKLISVYPIKSIEDPFAEEDWTSWKKITTEIGKDVQIVGDDLFVTNTKRLKKGITEAIPRQLGITTLLVLNFVGTKYCAKLHRETKMRII